MIASKFLIRILLVLTLTSCGNKIAQTFPTAITAKVIGVIDGDTIEVLYDEKPLRIRLAHIDCPEVRKGQPFNRAAKQLASDLCFGRQVHVLSEGEFDRWERLIAVVINDKQQNVNKEMLRAGLAWHYKRYSTDASYAQLETEARKNKMGIWVDENAVAPWEWRQGKAVKQ